MSPAAQAATARAIANRNEDERKRARARAAAPHQVHGVVKIAMAQIGDGYAWGGNGPDAFDCSGLTAYAFASAGVALPAQLAGPGGAGPPVARDDIRPGDLVFFSTAGPGASHVGVATGATTVVSATNSGVMEHSTGTPTGAATTSAPAASSRPAQPEVELQRRPVLVVRADRQAWAAVTARSIALFIAAASPRSAAPTSSGSGSRSTRARCSSRSGVALALYGVLAAFQPATSSAACSRPTAACSSSARCCGASSSTASSRIARTSRRCWSA